MKKEILVFSGWATTCDVWRLIIPALSLRYQVNCIAPSWVQESDFTASLNNVQKYVDELAQTIRSKQCLLAWSMGGLLAILLAKRHPQLVEKICLLSSVPKFVSREGRYAGIDYNWFQSFLEQYKQQPLRMLKKFLTLQVNGDEYAKQALVLLKDACPLDTYNLQECQYGLQILSDFDLTTELLNIKCDIEFIHGEQDAVVNVDAAQYFAKTSCSPLHLIPGAGHAPHLSHPSELESLIQQVFN